jgi:hypothetical protein
VSAHAPRTLATAALTTTALAILLLAVAGCSSKGTASTTNGASPGSGGNGSSKQATLPDCPTSAAISAALGITYGDLVQTNSAKERNCNCAPSCVETGLAALSFQILPGAGDFAGVKAGYSGGRAVANIEGLGDEAFSSVLNAGPSPMNTVAARKGLLIVLVSSFATVDKEKAFIAPLLG